MIRAMADQQKQDSPTVLADDLGEPIVTLDAAERYLLEIKDALTNISVQLANRNRTNAEGERMKYEEYWAWREKAMSAMAHRTKRLREVKMYIADLKRRARGEEHVRSGEREATARRLLWESYPYLERPEWSGDAKLGELRARIRELFGEALNAEGVD